MAQHERDQLETAVPEADRLEQEQQADPQAARQPEWPVVATKDVDEADQLEQAQEVPADTDEDYAPDPP